MLTWPDKDDARHSPVRIILLHSLHDTLSRPSVQRVLGNSHGITPTEIEGKLAKVGAASLRMLGSLLSNGDITGEDDFLLLPLLVTLECPRLPWRSQSIKDGQGLQESLAAIGQGLCERGFKVGWRLKSMLMRCFGDALKQQPNAFVEQLDLFQTMQEQHSGADARVVTALSCDEVLDEYVDAVVGVMGQEGCLEILQTLVVGLEEKPGSPGMLTATHRLLQSLRGRLPLLHRASRSSFTNASQDTCDDDGDKKSMVLAALHSLLAKQLPVSTSARQFVQVVKSLHLLLEQQAPSMTQWNIETTLSSVSTICAAGPKNELMRSFPGAFEWLCRLVRIVITRHRLRLKGHFHLLIAVLQSLLTCLILYPHVVGSPLRDDTTAQSTTKSDPAEIRAKAYARLITLVCEPSVASVTRSQTGSLESATDVAKREAGQHMYLVLLAYVRLQLDGRVPHAAREALEPAVYSILDITSDERRRIMSESMDESGRAILRDMVRQYRRFGKWTGV